MPTYACVYVSEFAAQAMLRLRPGLAGQPVAIVEGEPPFERICSRNKQAARTGICLGASRAEAQLCEALLLRRSLFEEESARAALLGYLGLFTPAIELVAREGACICVLDLSGTEKLLGPLAAATAKIRSGITELRLTASIATGNNFDAVVAMAPAQRRPIVHIPQGEEREHLALLPLSALALSAEHAKLFASWGLQTLGDVAALPSVELIARIGQHGKHLGEIARGEHPHYFQPYEPATSFEEYLEFDAPVEAIESLLFSLNLMLGQLLARVRSYAYALASITLHCGLEGVASAHSRIVRPALPTEERHVLLKLLQLDLEAHRPAAGVLTLRLVGETGPVSRVQLGLFSPQLPEPMRLEVTLARIYALVGQGRAGKAMLNDTHAEDAFSVQKFTARPDHARRPLRSWRRASHALRRLRPPQPVLVEVGEQSLRVLWHNSVPYQMQRLYGPWKTSGCWWSEQAWSARRWDFAAQAEDGSMLAGVLVQASVSSRTWMLEGIYD